MVLFKYKRKMSFCAQRLVQRNAPKRSYYTIITRYYPYTIFCHPVLYSKMLCFSLSGLDHSFPLCTALNVFCSSRTSLLWLDILLLLSLAGCSSTRTFPFSFRLSARVLFGHSHTVSVEMKIYKSKHCTDHHFGVQIHRYPQKQTFAQFIEHGKSELRVCYSASGFRVGWSVESFQLSI